MNNYSAVPFWMAYVVTTHLGPYLLVSWQAVCGTLLAIIYMSIMNFLMHGGAGHSQDPAYVETSWLPGGYNGVTAFTMTVIFVFAATASPALSLGTKQYMLCMLSGLIVGFMDPTRK